MNNESISATLVLISILAVLKIINIIDITWIWVISPLIISITLELFKIVFIIIKAIFKNN